MSCEFSEADWNHTFTRLEQAGEMLKSARQNQRDAFKHARGLALDMIHLGLSEAEAARILGVDRMTVRKWRGKR